MNPNKLYQINLVSNHLDDTIRIGEILGEKLPSHSILALQGPLAAGKTALTRAFFSARGYTDDVCSPTYTIINEYRSGDDVSYHMDVYRLDDISELDYTGFDECIQSGEVIVIEWADMINEILPEHTVTIKLELTNIADQRLIRINLDQEELYHILLEALNDYLGD